MAFKQPTSVLVVIYTQALDVLLLERYGFSGGWQSVTGSREGNDSLPATAVREVGEETGLHIGTRELDDWGLAIRYEIYERWRHRYAEGVTYNTEHVFGLCLPTRQAITLNQFEHVRWQWCPWQEAAQKVFSPSNALAIRLLPQRTRNKTI